MLFDIYGAEVTPAKAYTSRMHDRAATAMFLDFLGRDRRPETLSRRDWDRFIRARRAGRSRSESVRPVSDQTIGGDLTFLMAVLNWAARSKRRARPLAPRQKPAQGSQESPSEKNPVRVVVTDRGIPGASEGVPPGRLAVPRRTRCWRTRPGTESGLSGTSGGPMSTSTEKPSCGVASTRRRDTSTGVRCPPRRSPFSSRRRGGGPESGTRQCCLRRRIP